MGDGELCEAASFSSREIYFILVFIYYVDAIFSFISFSFFFPLHSCPLSLSLSLFLSLPSSSFLNCFRAGSGMAQYRLVPFVCAWKDQEDREIKIRLLLKRARAPVHHATPADTLYFLFVCHFGTLRALVIVYHRFFVLLLL